MFQVGMQRSSFFTSDIDTCSLSTDIRYQPIPSVADYFLPLDSEISSVKNWVHIGAHGMLCLRGLTLMIGN